MARTAFTCREINNAPPGPGAIGPRRPFPKISFVPGTVFPSSVNVASSTFPVSTINLLENSAQSWYDAGYVNLRRRYSHGLSFLTNYTFSKNLSDAPDFRSPTFESSIPQNNSDLAAEKAAACDVKHRFAMSLVYDLPAATAEGFVNLFTRNWHLSTIYQVQSGLPLTISVFGDTANSGVVLGENPIRANVTGQPIFGAGTHTADAWFNTAAFCSTRCGILWQCAPEHRSWARLPDLGLAMFKTFKDGRAREFHASRGSIQCL